MSQDVGPRERSKWPTIRLSEVVAVNPGRPALQRSDDAPTAFVPMSAISESLGTVQSYAMRPFGEVAKGYTYFEEGDLLFAKITPCMQNGKHAIVRNIPGGFGFGSTEFHVIRVSDRVDSGYLWYFLRQSIILSDAATHFRGAVGQQRVPPSYLENLTIPLPAVSVQRRIVAKLDEQMAVLDRAEKALAEQQAAASAVATAVLQQAFSGPECTRWPSVRLVRAGTFDAGGTPAKDQQRYWSDTGYPFVTGADITSATVGARNARAFLTQEGLVSGKTAVCPVGTVLVVTRTRVGRVGIAGETVAVSQDITAFTCQRNLLPTYVMWFLRKESDHLIAQSRGATIQGLRRSVLEDLDIPVPSIPEQRQIAESIEQATHNVAMLQQSITYQLGTLTSLRTSFLDAAFSGEI